MSNFFINKVLMYLDAISANVKAVCEQQEAEMRIFSVFSCYEYGVRPTFDEFKQYINYAYSQGYSADELYIELSSGIVPFEEKLVELARSWRRDPRFVEGSLYELKRDTKLLAGPEEQK